MEKELLKELVGAMLLHGYGELKLPKELLMKAAKEQFCIVVSEADEDNILVKLEICESMH